jgi:cyclin C
MHSYYLLPLDLELARNSFRDYDSFLVAATCVYLATKIEETPMHIKNIVNEMRHVMEGLLIFFECHG